MNRKPVKHAICIGINAVSEAHYHTEKPFSSGVASAKLLAEVFEHSGFQNVLCWKNHDGTAIALMAKIREFAKTLKTKDTLAISFSGHGAKVRDSDYGINKSGDEGWCLYDRVFFFFELWELLLAFDSGVGIIIISDACYSGIGSIEKRDNFGSIQSISYLSTRNHIYNPLIDNAIRPMNFQIPPAFLFLSASSEEGGSHELSGTLYTVFSKAIYDSWKKDKNANFHIFWEKVMLEVIKHNTDYEPKNQHPYWHYYQGHKNIKLSNKNLINLNSI